MTSCFVYKVIRDLESIYHLCINPIRRIGLIHKRYFDTRVSSSKVYTIVLYLAIVITKYTSLSFLVGTTVIASFFLKIETSFKENNLLPLGMLGVISFG